MYGICRVSAIYRRPAALQALVTGAVIHVQIWIKGISDDENMTRMTLISHRLTGPGCWMCEDKSPQASVEADAAFIGAAFGIGFANRSFWLAICGHLIKYVDTVL